MCTFLKRGFLEIADCSCKPREKASATNSIANTKQKRTTTKTPQQHITNCSTSNQNTFQQAPYPPPKPKKTNKQNGSIQKNNSKNTPIKRQKQIIRSIVKKNSNNQNNPNNHKSKNNKKKNNNNHNKSHNNNNTDDNKRNQASQSWSPKHALSQADEGLFGGEHFPQRRKKIKGGGEGYDQIAAQDFTPKKVVSLEIFVRKPQNVEIIRMLRNTTTIFLSCCTRACSRKIISSHQTGLLLRYAVIIWTCFFCDLKNDKGPLSIVSCSYLENTQN